jgi:hypothetical protein
MYRYRYINKHVQFGATNFTLVLEDLEDGMPTVRLEKCFHVNPSQIDESFLYTHAAPEIIAATNAFNAAQAELQAQVDSGDQ